MEHSWAGPLRRSRLERLHDMLEVIARHGPVRRTHIMYKANLTWGHLCTELAYLKSLSFIETMVSESGTFYTLTENGRSILSRLREIDDALREAEDERAPRIGVWA